MKIVTLCGSARPDGSNHRLLRSLDELWPDSEINHLMIHELPLFTDLPRANLPDTVVDFKNVVAGADAVILCTPEYAHNLPAALKNALEWLVASGELSQTKVVPITLTPQSPRGEKAMQSLCWTLAALDATIVTQLSLYREDVSYQTNDVLASGCTARALLLALKEALL